MKKCKFPKCKNPSHGHGLCMGHNYQLRKAGWDESKLKPLRSGYYGPDARRVEVRSGLSDRDILCLEELGSRVEARDPREVNTANIGARHLVREYAAGRGRFLQDNHLPIPADGTASTQSRVCLRHVGGKELKALMQLGKRLPPRDGSDKSPDLRALRHLIRAYAAGVLILE